jgi:hypothetical protein
MIVQILWGSVSLYPVFEKIPIRELSPVIIRNWITELNRDEYGKIIYSLISQKFN